MILHPDDVDSYRRASEFAGIIARQFGMTLGTIEPKRRPHPGGHEGLCYQSENRIAIVFRWRVAGCWWRNPLQLSRVLRTVCHEIAHCGPSSLPDGVAHRALELRMVEWARGQGYTIN